MLFMIEWLGANWFSLVTFIIGSILTILVSYLFRNRKILKIQEVHSEVIKKSEKNLPGIEIQYCGKQVERLVKSTFCIWNGGNTIITKEDISNIDNLRCEAEKDTICLIDSDSIFLGRSACNTNVQGHSSPFLITFDFLDKHDGLIFSVVHDSKIMPEIRGVIRGTRIIKINNGDSVMSNLRDILLMAIFPLVSSIFNGIFKSQNIGQVPLIVLSFIVFLAIMFVISKIRKKINPKNIIKNITDNRG